MTIRFSKRYKKQYKKLSVRLQRQTKLRIELWQEDPTNAILRLHRLEDKLARYYSINITGDIRALYEIIDDEIHMYDMIGSHSQLYG
jgi:mRNA-degrading endonuclease YafQ of YafQ-DinJ toxin-antitoxin module